MSSIQITDTHTHLNSTEFDADLPQVMERAAAEGVTKFYLPGIDSTTIDSMLKTEADYPGKCFAMMGLHPCYVKENYLDELKLVEDWLQKRRFAAVGEIGLDYYWDTTHVEQQTIAFHRQIEWALQYDLPIVIHSRQAMDDCIQIVREHQFGKLRGIFHCFNGNAEQAQQIVDAGFYLGIGGVLTYKKSGVAEALANISLEHMVLETDAPYLTPVPFRGKRNESSYLTYIADKLAEVKGVSREAIAEITSKNAEKIFGS
ncbi:TatD family hydrolase [Pseudoflavitalea sp. G-6-1-2]|uniref:TatD family hydrolase n=1 Tax=Pseudoflavitalea sp. G-6-1-2 TaxID=2728841 RepID=UPI00146EC4AC|nr:TatD family hydrolase [Pseudoflavitalea sp. G-6-1-2]NML19417.1 TatD family hydrolase [Pseudoflavitalea sp. G-6-1-2]